MEIKTYLEAVQFCSDFFKEKKEMLEIDYLQVLKTVEKLLAGPVGSVCQLFEDPDTQDKTCLKQPVHKIKLGDSERFVSYSGENAWFTVIEAESDKIAYEAACEIAVDIITRGERLPEPLATFTAEVLRGNFKKPNKKGQDLRANRVRDSYICEAVLKLKYFEYKPITRNDASAPISACDAVVEGLKSIDVYMEYQAVKKIYHRTRGTISI